MSFSIFLIVELMILLGKLSFIYVKKQSCTPIIVDDFKLEKEIYLKTNDDLTISCKAEVHTSCAKGNLTLEWYKNTEFVSRMLQNTHSLMHRFKLRKAAPINSGRYTCFASNRYGQSDISYNVSVSQSTREYEPSHGDDSFLPNDTRRIVKDKIYLLPSMKNFYGSKLASLGINFTLECRFYTQLNMSEFTVYWYKHILNSSQDQLIKLKNDDKMVLSISKQSCISIDHLTANGCVYANLTITNTTINDQAKYICSLERTIQRINFTHEVFVDASSIDKTNTNFESYLNFNINSSICQGQNYSFTCDINEHNSILYLYKLNSSVDLTAEVINLRTSIILDVKISRSDNEKLEFTITNVSSKDGGRYLCIVECLTKSDKWRVMFLTVTECKHSNSQSSGNPKYFVVGMSVICFLFIVAFILFALYCEKKYNKMKYSNVKKRIMVEYESPIYKSFLSGEKSFKTDVYHVNILLPDSHPLLPPVIKIKPIRRSMKLRGRNPGELLPSTSTDRTRLDSTRHSSQLENEVFESNGCSDPGNLNSNIRKSSSIEFDSLYDFPCDPIWEFPRERLDVSSKKLGEGAFGLVYEGKAIDLGNVRGPTKIAVKVMRDDFCESKICDFVKEIEIMKQLGNHPNVIRLLGVCTQRGPLRVIVEFAPHGNLRDYLRGKRLSSSKRKNSMTEISPLILSNYSLQIAQGMTYLASKSVVHRDLSARNILIGEDFVMKIADFGLTRIVDYYYRKKTDGILPVKWMAPEALLEKKYTTKSDVWSYGILIWEIFSLGETPYPTVMPEKIVEVIRKGIQNPQPALANFPVYNLMRTCWNLCSDSRPHFFQIVEILQDIIHKSTNNEMVSSENIYQCETPYLEMDMGYLEPKLSS